MKTFIVAALLVAAVAGQSTMDILKLNKEKSLLAKFDRPAYPMIHDYERNNMIDTMTNKYTGEFDYDTTTVYTIDEIMSHPLFREYMSLPVFRQYWQYPMFQRYVASIYFQRFWQIPTFQQYFMSPALFYKYIFPIVQLFKYDSATMNTYTSGDWIWNKNSYNTYPYTTYPYNSYPYNTESDYHYGQQDLVTKNVPTMCHYNSVYCQALLEKMYNHMQMMMTYGQEDMHMQMPYETTYSKMYNPYINRMMEGYYNRYPTFETEKMTPYMFNKERMYNNVHFNNDMYMNTYETPKMVDEIMTTPTGIRFEKIHPTYNYNMMGVKSFDKKFMPETLIKA